MKEKFKTPITNENLYQLDLESIQDVYRMMARRVESSVETSKAIQGKCMSILGWLVAGLASLIGVVVIELDSSFRLDWKILGPAIWGFVSILFISIRLVVMALYKVETFSSGDVPSMVLRDDVMRACAGYNLYDRHKHILGYEINQLQIHLERDMAVNARIVSAYRSTITLILVALLIAAVVTLSCYFLF